MQTTGARRRKRPEGADRAALPDRLEADIDDQLDAELFATASTVGVPDPETEGTILPQQGDLAETEVAQVLGRAFQEVWTGQLLLRSRAGEKTIHLDAGRPVFATSTAPEDRLCEMLLRQGRLDADQRTRVARTAVELGRRTGAVLVDFGLLKPGELLPVLRGQHEEIILSVLPWQEGSFVFDARAQLDARKARLLRHPALLVRQGLRRGHPPSRLRRLVGAPGTVFALARGPDTADLLAELGLEPAEQRVLSWFDGVRSLQEVIRASGQAADLASELVFVLRCFGLLAPVPAGRGLGRRSFDGRVDRERVLARFALIQDADYFQILGIDRDASAAEVARAHRQLSREMNPQWLAPEVAGTLAREIEVVREVLDEAARILTDDALRRSYREHLGPPAGPRSSNRP
jgi:hypothetical protein